MDSREFEDLVRAEAQHHDVTTLQSIHILVGDLIARRQAEKPPDLRVGSAVHASHLDYEWHTYGLVVEADAERCLIQTPGRANAESVVFREHHIRVLSDDEWAHVEPRLRKRNERIALERQRLEAG